MLKSLRAGFFELHAPAISFAILASSYMIVFCIASFLPPRLVTCMYTQTNKQTNTHTHTYTHTLSHVHFGQNDKFIMGTIVKHVTTVPIPRALAAP